MKSSLKDQVVIITGASSGIGEACAKRLVAEGAKVMLAARREDRLKKLTESLGRQTAFKRTDVSSHLQMKELADATLRQFGRIDVLINNAGVMPLSFLASGKVEEWDRMIDINIKGVLYGINVVLSHMLRQESGHVINISSVGGHLVMPSSAVYSGTKFAVWAISEGLRQETVGKIRVTTICPGAVTTELVDSITDEEIKANITSFAAIAIQPEAIADGIVYALQQPRDVSVSEIIIRPTAQQL